MRVVGDSTLVAFHANAILLAGDADGAGLDRLVIGETGVSLTRSTTAVWSRSRVFLGGTVQSGPYVAFSENVTVIDPCVVTGGDAVETV